MAHPVLTVRLDRPEHARPTVSPEGRPVEKIHRVESLSCPLLPVDHAPMARLKSPIRHSLTIFQPLDEAQ